MIWDVPAAERTSKIKRACAVMPLSFIDAWIDVHTVYLNSQKWTQHHDIITDAILDMVESRSEAIEIIKQVERN